MNKPKILLLSGAIILTLILAWDFHVYWPLRDPLRAKTTEGRMRDLMSVLEAEQPQRLETESLRSILAKYNRAECLEDAWGTPFLIERSKADRQLRYTIISLGRDRRRGACCVKWVENWDDDAVLSGKDWLQVWYPEAVQAQGKAH